MLITSVKKHMLITSAKKHHVGVIRQKTARARTIFFERCCQHCVCFFDGLYQQLSFFDVYRQNLFFDDGYWCDPC